LLGILLKTIPPEIFHVLMFGELEHKSHSASKFIERVDSYNLCWSNQNIRFSIHIFDDYCTGNWTQTVHFQSFKPNLGLEQASNGTN
jgi:hypothetical protein